MHQLKRYALWTCRKHSSLQPLGGSSSAPRSSTKGPCSYVLELGGQPCHLCRVLEQVQELLRALASLSLGVGRTKCGILLLLVVFIVSGMQVPRSVQTVGPACKPRQQWVCFMAGAAWFPRLLRGASTPARVEGCVCPRA